MSKLRAWRELVRTSFRPKYKFPVNSAKNWFPGHMHKGLKDMQRKVIDVDCVIEVHDARIPFSGRNTTFKETISGVKPHILILNKEDLVPKQNREQIIQKIKESDPIISEVMFANASSGHCPTLKTLLPKSIKLIEKSNRYDRVGNPEKIIIIIGIPNVGKSTIINKLRNSNLQSKGKATKVGASPGVTRAVQEKIRICNRPLVYLLDTPGISKPNVKDMHVGMKLAACNTLNDMVIGQLYICDYLLWYLNTHHHFDYVEYMGLSAPEEDCNLMLAKSALANGNIVDKSQFGVKKKLPDYEYLTMKFLQGFRKGHFGRFYLDEDQLMDNLNDHLDSPTGQLDSSDEMLGSSEDQLGDSKQLYHQNKQNIVDKVIDC